MVLQQSPTEVVIVDRVQTPSDLIAARKAIAMEPKLFDVFVGYYQFPGHTAMHVYRDNEHFLTQLPGQPPVEVFPEGPHDFFANVVNAQISFQLDAQGHASGLVLHQNGHELSAPRLDDATAKQWEDALNAKVQQQVADPGSEQALRRLISQLASGKPEYDQMSPELADLTRQQLPTLHSELAAEGALVSLKFTGVGPGGGDIYVAKFDQGSQEWRIKLIDGKVVMAGVRPVQ